MSGDIVMTAAIMGQMLLRSVAAESSPLLQSASDDGGAVGCKDEALKPPHGPLETIEAWWNRRPEPVTEPLTVAERKQALDGAIGWSRATYDLIEAAVGKQEAERFEVGTAMDTPVDRPFHWPLDVYLRRAERIGQLVVRMLELNLRRDWRPPTSADEPPTRRHR